MVNHIICNRCITIREQTKVGFRVPERNQEVQNFPKRVPERNQEVEIWGIRIRNQNKERNQELQAESLTTNQELPGSINPL